MKTYLTLPIALLISIFARQTEAQITMADEEMSQGMQPAFIIEVDVDDSRLVGKVWDKFMDDYGGRTKRVKGGSGEQLTTGANIAAINAGKPMEIYSRTEKSEGGITIHKVWIKVGDVFIDKHNSPDAYKEAVKVLEQFALECKIAKTNEELADAEKKLRELENDLERLKRQNDGYHRDIENYEKRIEQAKENIKKNEEQQVEMAKNIELQKQILEEIRQRLKDLRNNG
ncbi:MAG: hypothetical protein KatS3mg029_0055 [Saprospiraceae bacterium]|nr:MAG: hypothetical protein KatS3mg029_0055 [Saprospiraceae bacterium]